MKILKGWFFEVLKERDDVPKIKSKTWRFILLPITIIWFLFQLIAFSYAGGHVCLFLGVGGIIFSVFSMPDEREVIFLLSLLILLLPIFAPFLWWYKYFKYGEYSVLIQD